MCVGGGGGHSHVGVGGGGGSNFQNWGEMSHENAAHFSN